MKNVLILSSGTYRNENSDTACNKFMRRTMKRTIILTAIFLFLANATKSYAQKDADNFYKSPAIRTESVSFQNLYKMKIGAALFLPQDMKADVKYPAIIVGHPMGAVKEQSANLYATKMAERGFVTLSIDLTFGEKAVEKYVMRFLPTCMRKRSAPLLIFWEQELLSTVNVSELSAFAAAEVLPSVQPRQIPV